MKVKFPPIYWHNQDPILSIDFQINQGDFYRLASGGVDSHVIIWHVTYDKYKSVKIEYASDLSRHNKSINIVRFSPTGEYLASGDDEGLIYIWKLRNNWPTLEPTDDEHVNKEEWYTIKLLRGHLEDVYDVSWSKDGNFLVSASMDNTVIMWDMQKCVKMHIFSDFKGHVQGVSWDPCNQFIASVGSDRILRMHSISSKQVIYKISKFTWSTVTESNYHKYKLFYDDTFKSYFRRLTFTPDGELLIVPSGIVSKKGTTENTTFIFSKHSPNQPVISLPSGNKCTVAVRCNPLLFNLRSNQHKDLKQDHEPIINLPYRMIFAVATYDSVLIYDTEQLVPFAYISNIHYSQLTDLAWSPDGLILLVSSTDGYCSFITFSKEEMGEIYVSFEGKENDDKNGDFINVKI